MQHLGDFQKRCQEFDSLPASARVKEERVQNAVRGIIKSSSLMNQELFNRFKDILFKADVRLLCRDGHIVNAVRKHLEESSPVFKAMFAHDMLEARTSKISFENYSEISVRILNYFCSARNHFEELVENVTEEVYVEIILLAGEYQLPQLISRVSRPDLSWDANLKIFNLSSQHTLQNGGPVWESVREESAKYVARAATSLRNSSKSKEVLSHLSTENMWDLQCDIKEEEESWYLYGGGGENGLRLVLNKHISYGSYYISNTFGKYFQLILVSNPLEDPPLKWLPIIWLVGAPCLGSIPVKARKFYFTLHSNSFHLAQNFGTESPTLPSLETALVVSEREYEHTFIFSERKSVEEIIAWGRKLFQNNSHNAFACILRDSQDVRAFVRVRSDTTLLSTYIQWAQNHCTFHNVLEAWEYYRTNLNWKIDSILSGCFVSYVSTTFEHHCKNIDLLSEENFGKLLSLNDLSVSSELKTLETLLCWCKVKNILKCGHTRLVAFFKNSKHQQFGKLGRVDMSSVRELEKKSKQSRPNLMTVNVDVNGHVAMDVPTRELIFYRDASKLLPLVRFPFISKLQLASLEIWDKEFLKNTAIGVSILNEAWYIQLSRETGEPNVSVRTKTYPLSPELCKKTKAGLELWIRTRRSY